MRITTALIIVLISCAIPNEEVSKTETPYNIEVEQIHPPEEIIEISVKAVLDSFSYKSDNEYYMGKKYIGKLICITGRTSGVSEEGVLRLQYKRFGRVISCYGIVDDEFLFSIQPEDVVSITGIFQRKNEGGLVGIVNELSNCVSWKKIN